MFSKKWTTYKTQRLNKFMKRKYKKTANLLTGATEQSEEDQVENLLSKPNSTITKLKLV